MDFKIVIGANYGDEGKGLATRYFAREALNRGEKVLVVLFNGGAQRGHTVEVKPQVEGKIRRHVFHHFGCGTFDGADTYYADGFIINPLVFQKEYNTLLAEDPSLKINVFVSPNCRVTTPYDMIINQIVERHRQVDKKNHGSCGMGIYETVKRYENSGDIRWSAVTGCLKGLKGFNGSWLQNLAKSMPRRLYDEYHIGYTDLFDDEKNLVDRSITTDFINNFIEACIFLEEHSSMVGSTRRFLERYGTVICEGAQGLALDKDNIWDYPYLTPSNTTSYNVMKYASLNPKTSIEICYVTRTYFTKHGAGRFLSECPVESICNEIQDKTNVTNPWQESIRYGYFDTAAFRERCRKDYNASRQVAFDCELKKTVMVTHLNYTNNKIRTEDGDLGIEDVCDFADKIYTSNTPYAEDVIIR